MWLALGERKRDVGMGGKLTSLSVGGGDNTGERRRAEREGQLENDLEKRGRRLRCGLKECGMFVVHKNFSCGRQAVVLVEMFAVHKNFLFSCIFSLMVHAFCNNALMM